MKVVYTGTKYKRLEGFWKELKRGKLGGLFRPTNKRRNKIPEMNGGLHN